MPWRVSFVTREVSQVLTSYRVIIQDCRVEWYWGKIICGALVEVAASFVDLSPFSLKLFVPVKQVAWYSHYFYCILIGAFTLMVRSFGGIFASDFKRAFKIIIRFDCQDFVGRFVFLYFNSIVKSPRPLIASIITTLPAYRADFA